MMDKETVERWLSEPTQCLHGSELALDERKRIKAVYFRSHGTTIVIASIVVLIMILVDIIMIELITHNYTIIPNGAVIMIIEAIVLLVAIIIAMVYIRKYIAEAVDMLIDNYICTTYTLDGKLIEKCQDGSSIYYLKLGGKYYEALDSIEFSLADVGDLCYLIYVGYEPTFVARVTHNIQ